MKRFLIAAVAALTVVTLLTSDAEAQLLRRRANCSSGSCGVSSGCNLSGSQGCNISQNVTRASAADLFQLPAAPAPAAPAAAAAEAGARVEPKRTGYAREAAMAFCAPVATVNERYVAARPDRAVDFVAAR